MEAVLPSSAGAAPTVQAANDAIRPAARLDYVDALRVVLILLVVGHHSVEAYVARHVSEIVLSDAPIPRVWAFLAVNAAFFMGLFFFLGGYFTPDAFDRKGMGRFIADRWTRLGIPLLIGVVLLVPLANWMRLTLSPGIVAFPFDMGYWHFFIRDFLGIGPMPELWPVRERWPQLNFGWLWFVEHLLIYAMLYAAWRAITPARVKDAVAPAPPTGRAIIGYAVALAAASFVIRIWFPINDWIAFLGFWQMEPAHWPQYASLFAIGLVAGRGRWIETMDRRRGLTWLAVGIGLSVFLYVMVGLGVIGDGAPSVASAGSGGVHLPDWKGCIWEAFTCTALCVGLPVAFRELAWGAGRLWRMLARNVLAIYVFHFPIVLALQWALTNTDLPKWSRLLLTWPVAVIVTVAFTNFVVLRIPGLRRVF
jgi:fucose 4-O-acetylase-like acetyltransferase